MMSFKEFYLQGSKGSKGTSKTARSFKAPKRRNTILDRLAKLKATKRRSGQ